MPRPHVSIAPPPPDWYTAGVEALIAQMQLPVAFPAEVEAAAAALAADPPVPPGEDRTDLGLVTLDPVGSKDLDQAFFLERVGSGFRVSYAIADVASFVAPGGPIDLEAHRRVETLYAPDRRIPLHPPVLSEGAASLLPGETRPAVLWTIDLDATGEATTVDVRRARVRSRAQLDYESVQRELDAGTADDLLLLLREIGGLRLERERARGGVGLPLPEQVVGFAGGAATLTYRAQPAVEEWNAQLSLLTGMAAAGLMLAGNVGLLRTLPPPELGAVEGLRRRARALGLPWGPEVSYPEFVRSIDPATPAGAAMLTACTRLLRGASYLAFDGTAPERAGHAAIAAPYAHVTAPLRRLADRYAAEVCLALCAKRDVPDWVRAALPGLPEEMDDGARRGHGFAAEVVNLIEAGLLRDRVGESFAGVVVSRQDEAPTKGSVLVRVPAIEAKVTGATDLPLGEETRVTLAAADPATRQVAFAWP